MPAAATAEMASVSVDPPSWVDRNWSRNSCADIWEMVFIYQDCASTKNSPKRANKAQFRREKKSFGAETVDSPGAKTTQRLWLISLRLGFGFGSLETCFNVGELSKELRLRLGSHGWCDELELISHKVKSMRDGGLNKKMVVPILDGVANKSLGCGVWV